MSSDAGELHASTDESLTDEPLTEDFFFIWDGALKELKELRLLKQSDMSYASESARRYTAQAEERVARAKANLNHAREEKRSKVERAKEVLERAKATMEHATSALECTESEEKLNLDRAEKELKDATEALKESKAYEATIGEKHKVLNLNTSIKISNYQPLDDLGVDHVVRSCDSSATEMGGDSSTTMSSRTGEPSALTDETFTDESQPSDDAGVDHLAKSPDSSTADMETDELEAYDVSVKQTLRAEIKKAEDNFKVCYYPYVCFEEIVDVIEDSTQHEELFDVQHEAEVVLTSFFKHDSLAVWCSVATMERIVALCVPIKQTLYGYEATSCHTLWEGLSSPVEGELSNLPFNEIEKKDCAMFSRIIHGFYRQNEQGRLLNKYEAELDKLGSSYVVSP